MLKGDVPSLIIMTLHLFTALFPFCSRKSCRFVIMTTCAAAFLFSALLPLSLSQWNNAPGWLYARNGQGIDLAFLQADGPAGACPDVCDCPPAFPVAMYCDGRGLTAVPSIPSYIKYLYLQNNAIAALPDSALANATSLVWLMLHHNQLTSGAVGAKVTRRDQTQPHVSGAPA